MGLFDFFKRKKKDKFDINNSSLNEQLCHGIRFEDSSKFLQWGVPLKDLAKDIEVKEKLFADRSVYNWGERTILNGLSLPLTTTFWNHREDSIYKIFYSVNFSITGNEEVRVRFESIKEHLQNLFGDAKHQEIAATEAIFEWLVNDTRLKLHFLEQYTNKLNFDINKI